MGESQNDPLRLDFDRQLNREFHGSTVTSDAVEASGGAHLGKIGVWLYVMNNDKYILTSDKDNSKMEPMRRTAASARHGGWSP